MPDQISAELAQLIDDSITSLVQLEALLLLRRERARVWNIDELAKSLYIGREMCEAQLSELERSGFLVRSNTTELGYQYQPKTSELDLLVGELDSLYHERRVAVIGRIYSKPVNKVQTFADAFRLRKKE